MRTNMRLTALERKHTPQSDLSMIPDDELDAVLRESMHAVAAQYISCPAWLARAVEIYDSLDLPEPSQKTRAIVANANPKFDRRDDKEIESELERLTMKIIEWKEDQKN